MALILVIVERSLPPLGFLKMIVYYGVIAAIECGPLIHYSQTMTVSLSSLIFAL